MLTVVAIGSNRDEYKDWFIEQLGKSKMHHVLIYEGTPNISYAEAVNKSMKAVFPTSWVLLTNNDVEISKPIETGGLFANCLYGFETYQMGDIEYLSGFCYLFHYALWEIVGEWDENFKPFCFEDIDWFLRVKKKGFSHQELSGEEYGIRHLEKDRQKIRSEIMPQYLSNLNYLKEKHNLE